MIQQTILKEARGVTNLPQSFGACWVDSVCKRIASGIYACDMPAFLSNDASEVL